MSLSSLFTWLEPTALLTWDRQSGSCCAVTHSGGWTAGPTGASGFFPEGSQQRGGKKELPILLPKDVFKNVK